MVSGSSFNLSKEIYLVRKLDPCGRWRNSGKKVRDCSSPGVGKGGVQGWLEQVGVMGRIFEKGCGSDLGGMDGFQGNVGKMILE